MFQGRVFLQQKKTLSRKLQTSKSLRGLEMLKLQAAKISCLPFDFEDSKGFFCTSFRNEKCIIPGSKVHSQYHRLVATLKELSKFWTHPSLYFINSLKKYIWPQFMRLIQNIGRNIHCERVAIVNHCIYGVLERHPCIFHVQYAYRCKSSHILLNSNQLPPLLSNKCLTKIKMHQVIPSGNQT